MRNIRRYPITLVEIEDCLLTLSQKIAKENEESEVVGDMTPILLKAAAKIVKRIGFVTYDLEG